MVPAPPRGAGTPAPVAGQGVPPEQTRARYPDDSDIIERDGVRVFYEVYGAGEPTILLLPTWSIIHSRFWKMQIPDLSRRYRVLTFDPRGNGQSDRPVRAGAYAETEYAADALAVMDATETERAVIVSLSIGAQRALVLASDHPERVSGAVFVGPALPLAKTLPGRELARRFTEELDTDEGWAKYNSHYWRRDYRAFLEFFFGECFSEPYSTKPWDDTVAWGLETDPESLILSEHGPGLADRDEVIARCRGVRCPVLVIHGSEDRIRPHAHGEALAEATGGRFVSMEGAGHIPNVRDPVHVNLLIRDFVRRVGTTRGVGTTRRSGGRG
ncbi:MAG: alpha/beta hydrolase [Chloroflexota bacterium]